MIYHVTRKGFSKTLLFGQGQNTEGARTGFYLFMTFTTREARKTFLNTTGKFISAPLILSLLLRLYGIFLENLENIS